MQVQILARESQRRGRYLGQVVQNRRRQRLRGLHVGHDERSKEEFGYQEEVPLRQGQKDPRQAGLQARGVQGAAGLVLLPGQEDQRQGRAPRQHRDRDHPHEVHHRRQRCHHGA